MTPEITRLKKSLTIVCSCSIAALLVFIFLEFRAYNFFKNEGRKDSEWYLVHIIMNLLMIGSIILFYNFKKIGLWIYFILVIGFFTITSLAGKGDTILGLMTPIYFITYSAIFINLGNQYKKMTMLHF